MQRWRPLLLLPHQALHARSVSFAWKNSQFRATAEPERGFTRFLDGEPLDEPDARWIDEFGLRESPPVKAPDEASPQ